MHLLNQMSSCRCRPPLLYGSFIRRHNWLPEDRQRGHVSWQSDNGGSSCQLLFRLMACHNLPCFLVVPLRNSLQGRSQAGVSMYVQSISLLAVFICQVSLVLSRGVYPVSALRVHYCTAKPGTKTLSALVILFKDFRGRLVNPETVGVGRNMKEDLSGDVQGNFKMTRFHALFLDIVQPRNQIPAMKCPILMQPRGNLPFTQQPIAVLGHPHLLFIQVALLTLLLLRAEYHPNHLAEEVRTLRKLMI